MKGLCDPELVHDFFSERTWDDIAASLKLKNDSYALELGVSFLSEDEFFIIYLYIFMLLCIIKMNFVFESDFFQAYLCPDFRSHDDFLNFILRFSDAQLLMLAQFMSYESEILKCFYASKACVDFWDTYL